MYELFNLSWDPSERTNLHNEPKLQERVKKMMEVFRAFPASGEPAN
jgi:arylsulfatase A